MLQQLAVRRPAGEIHAEFVVPNARATGTLTDRVTSAELLTLPFVERSLGVNLRQVIAE